MTMKESGQKVITIFYGVEPTDVRKQEGEFGKAFKDTCQGKTEDLVQSWTKALVDVASITGYDFRTCDDEAAMIEKIAAYISNKLNLSTPSHDFYGFIGMEAHMSRMNQFLRPDLDEVTMIGIWGPAGIGKTTIVRFLFNQISGGFQNSAFMENIKGKYPRPCFDEYAVQLQLQKEMLSQMINQDNIMIPHLGVARVRLGDKKVLLVLDDVDRKQQLEALAKNVQCFGPGSLIIITTEYLRLLQAHGIEHIYKMDFPSNDEALHMFCKYAFNQNSPKDGFNELAREIVHRVGNLPLGLKVIGSHFKGMPKEEWPMEVSRLRTNLHGDIESILKYTYDALCEEDQDLFLHIACFFNYMDIEKVKEYLAENFYHVGQRLQVLADKSLISIDFFFYNTIIRMNKLLAQLGKKIVRSGKLGERRFLFDRKDIRELIIDNHNTKMTRSAVGIYSKDLLKVTEKAFEGMYDLQFLIVNHGHVHRKTLRFLESLGAPYPKLDLSNFPMTSVRFGNALGSRVSLSMLKSCITSPGPLSFTSPNLRLLDWSYFPMTSLSFKDNLEFLVEFSMVSSQLEKLWDGTKLLRNLKWMNLEYSGNLKELPSLSTATNLKELVLCGCSSLVELPSSIGNATSLKFLDLECCSSLVELPYSIVNATSLNILNLSECSSLVELPSSIGNLANLKELELGKCSSLVELPSSTGNATSLHKLDLSACSSLVSLPQLPDSLECLDAQKCESLEKLDCSFCNPRILLNFAECFKLNKEARDLLIETTTTKLVVLPGKEVPECFTYRGYGSSVTVKLNQQQLRTSTKFKACVLFKEKNSIHWDTICVYTKKNKDGIQERGTVSCCIRDKPKVELSNPRSPIYREHLYIFEVAVEEVTSTELLFDFCYSHRHRTNEIKECGIIQLLEHHVDGNEAMSEKSSDQL